MATGITNTQIDEAIPNKGSSTPHAEQPNRKLTNAILKEIAAETNKLGTAATRDATAGGMVADIAVTYANWDALSASGLYRGSNGNSGNNPGYTGGSGALIAVRQDAQRVQFLAFSGASGLSKGTLKFKYLHNDPQTPWSEAVLVENLLQATGQSTQYPMTQKATTDAINGISDVRDKTEINEIGLGLEVIENINSFSFKLNKRDWYRQEAAKELIEVEENGKVIIQEKINPDVLKAPLSDFEENDGSLKRDDVYTGFVAQDIKETLEELGLGHFGIVKNYAEEYEGGEDRFYIEHLALLPFLVNSIKQLSARVKELEDAAK